MLDPRTLESRRDEIVESCKRRRFDVDIDAAIAAQERVAKAQTELNDLNRQRNEHQTDGKRKLKAAETDQSVSDLVNDAVRALLAEDEEDLSDARCRAGEGSRGFEEFVSELRERGSL